ncbi:MAG: hemerythrin domain-containing protein [Thermoproteus sp. AZ2]|jgi:hemerythrin superfamily protein|uniref:Hemerythrin domain-containing protein n=1 Tax=Thermoproteus sp. AZ2 TaxID=1609232 RepID=A0ACC6V2E2_9CREN
MDLIGLLEVEHAVLKTHFYYLQQLPDDVAWRELERIHEFLIKVHARMEDLYVFPLFPEKVVHPFSADHKLIESFGNNILRERERRRIERYIATVIYHNDHEESDLFPLVKRPLEIRLDVINEYGVDKYKKFTGLDPSKLPQL